MAEVPAVSAVTSLLASASLCEAPAAPSEELASGGPGEAELSPDEQEELKTARFRAQKLLATDEKFEVRTDAEALRSLAPLASFPDLILHPAVLVNISKEGTDGWTNPSGVQKKTLPALTHELKPNVLVQARGGSGKTGAFGLACLRNIDASRPSTQAIIISPTALLAAGIAGVLTRLAAESGISVALLPGGKTAIPAAHILIGTAGGFAQGIDSERLTSKRLGELRMLVIDEADDIVAHFKKELAKVHAFAATAVGAEAARSGAAAGGAGAGAAGGAGAAAGGGAAGAGGAKGSNKDLGMSRLQVLLFSASFEFLKPASTAVGARDCKDFADQLMGEAARVQLRPRIDFIEPPSAPNSTFFAIEANDDSLRAKVDELVRVFEEGGSKKTLVFVQSGKRVQEVLDELARRGKGYARGLRFFRQRGGGGGGDAKATMDAVKSAAAARKATVESFARGEFSLLIATDAMGRGIDIPQLKFVLNLDLPRTWDPTARRFVDLPEVTTFQHRCARVGRGLNYGASVSLVGSDSDAKVLAALAAHFEQVVYLLPSTPDVSGDAKLKRLFARYLTLACDSTVRPGPEKTSVAGAAPAPDAAAAAAIAAAADAEKYKLKVYLPKPAAAAATPAAAVAALGGAGSSA